MGIYARHVFPRLMERAIGTEEHMEHRRETLAPARGRVLEIGFGTGLNLPCYPDAVEELVAVEPRPALPRRVRERIRAAPFPVIRIEAEAGGSLPLEEGSFDTAVSTWTLCTIPDAVAALRRVRRLLAPGGRLLFLEHGRSDDPRTARWQDRLNPIQNVVGLGCNLNREIGRLIRAAGFEIEELERFRLSGAPRVAGEVYRGVARAGAAPGSPETAGGDQPPEGPSSSTR